MSPSVGNFVHDLVEMAKAMETLPLVQRELDEAQASNEKLSQAVADREASILKLKAEVEGLQAKVREAEVSRDDAELRFLEADEHIAAFRRLVSSFSSDTASLLRAIEPVKAEEPKAELVAAEGWSTPNIIHDPVTGPLSESGIGIIAGEGQRVSDPTAPSTEAQSAPTAQPQGEGATGLTQQTSGESAADPTANSPSGNVLQSAPSPVAETSSDAVPKTIAEQPSMPPVDSGPGYHNEPVRWTQEWYEWAGKMDARYGVDHWPPRDEQSSVA